MHLYSLSLPLLPCAEVGRPLFGSQTLALGVVLIGVALLMVAVALAGRWLAATHPAPPPPPVAAPVPPETVPSAEIFIVIAAAVAATLGRRARVAAIKPVTPPAEAMIQPWSVEGRRQIYSSHQIR